MTRMQATESRSHSVVNDTNAFGQWHECRLLSLDHTQWSMTRMLLVNDTNADTHPRSAFYEDGQWHECLWSMTRMQATESKSHSVVNDTNAFGQWHECMLLSLNHTQRSMTRMLLVNDTNAGYWVYITPSLQITECKLFSAGCKLFLTEFKIFLAGFKLFLTGFDLHSVHSCHWPCHWLGLYYPEFWVQQVFWWSIDNFVCWGQNKIFRLPFLCHSPLLCGLSACNVPLSEVWEKQDSGSVFAPSLLFLAAPPLPSPFWTWHRGGEGWTGVPRCLTFSRKPRTLGQFCLCALWRELCSRSSGNTDWCAVREPAWGFAGVGLQQVVPTLRWTPATTSLQVWSWIKGQHGWSVGNSSTSREDRSWKG